MMRPTQQAVMKTGTQQSIVPRARPVFECKLNSDFGKITFQGILNKFSTLQLNRW
jgi:hypothetical protein